MSIQSAFTLCSRVNNRKGKCQNGILRRSIHTGAFSFTKNGKPLAIGPGSTDFILPLARVNQDFLK